MDLTESVARAIFTVSARPVEWAVMSDEGKSPWLARARAAIYAYEHHQADHPPRPTLAPASEAPSR